MRTHRGVHRRIGALDMVPFVPLRDLGLANAVARVRAFREALGRTHGVPVYFPCRSRLPNPGAEAARRGIAVARAERVGLAPRTAFDGRSPDSVGLPDLTPAHYLDTHLDGLP